MGRVYTPKYRLDVEGVSAAVWSVRDYGKPTRENLLNWIEKYSRSLEIGGVNQHLSLALGYVPYPAYVAIRDNKTGETITEWKAAMFQVY